ncbi:MAG: DUF934 domain-containing protein [Betaproteobacteria bacterium]|nr:DUF934 domain-containing protein [Betaproteobacteria bacterium]
MTTLIRMRQVVQDNWRLLDPAADGALPPVPREDGDVIVPLALWRREREKLVARNGRLGVRLDAHEGPEEIADDIARFEVIAVHFPKFTDGRGYSTARLLRDRYGYKGELRAIGDVQRDQLLYLSRCGFDAFALKEGRDAEAALGAFSDFSEAYQSSVERPLPLFRRRFTNAPEGMEWS